LHHAVQQGLATLNGISYDEFYRLLPPNMPELVKELLAHGADPNARTTESVQLGPEGRSQRRTGHTALFLAALSGDAEIIRVLADNGADVLLAARGNTTPLMAAAGSIMFRWRGTIDKRIGDPLEAVKVMVELGADIHATNRQGQTAMHAAGFAGEDEVIQFLVDHGAKVDVEDRSGQTPWTMAKGMSPGTGSQGRYGSHPSAADLLVKLGATPRLLESIDVDPGAGRPVPQTPDQR
jgi:ankyrin repeat protein